MNIEEKVKLKLLARGFDKNTQLNNRGLIGATIDETILEVVKNMTPIGVLKMLKSKIDKAGLNKCNYAIETSDIEAINKALADDYEPYFGWCDVDGCENEGCSGGIAWRDTGYWTVCSKHSAEHRNGLEQPKMKQAAVYKESNRDKKTGYLTK